MSIVRSRQSAGFLGVKPLQTPPQDQSGTVSRVPVVVYSKIEVRTIKMGLWQSLKHMDNVIVGHNASVGFAEALSRISNPELVDLRLLSTTTDALI